MWVAQDCDSPAVNPLHGLVPALEGSYFSLMYVDVFSPRQLNKTPESNKRFIGTLFKHMFVLMQRAVGATRVTVSTLSEPDPLRA